MIPSVQFSKTLSALLGRLAGDKPDVDIERGALTFRVVTGSPEVATTFRIEMHGEGEYEVIHRIAPYRTQFASTKEAKDVAKAIIGAAQMVERALPDIEVFLASWVEPD